MVNVLHNFGQPDIYHIKNNVQPPTHRMIEVINEVNI